MVRRDFLVGAVAGGTVTGAAWLATRNPWKAHEHATPCFSQSGEDLIVMYVFRALGIQKPSYLDIGAFLPVFSNNTYLFYLAGGRGVLVEPNVDLTAELRRARPEDVTLPVGIGFSDKEDSLDYYRLDTPQLNTFDKDRADDLVRSGHKLVEVIKARLLPINRVIAEHFGGKSPDYLSIDVEGLDLSILKTLDFAKYRPKVICAETASPRGDKMEPGVADLLREKGYSVRGMTFPNTIFVDDKAWG
jgi:FkbM family methyltransferase